MARSWTKWVPAIAVPAVVIAAGAIIAPLSANATVNLPTKTPAQVVSLLASSTVDAFSGTVKVSSDLGLPELPATAGPSSDSSSASGLDLATGDHTARVYVDGKVGERIQILDKLAERDLVRNGTGLWAYSSKDNTVVHSVLPTETKRVPSTSVPSPDQLGTELVQRLEPTSTLSVTSAQRVAGRAAYTLVLEPKASDTLIGSIAIAVDSETGLPLSVEAVARGASDPAFRVAFSSLKLGTPSAKLFDFTPPADATVKQQAIEKPTARTGDAPKPTVTGTGWDAVVSVTPAAGTTALTSSPEFRQLSTAVTGGRLVHTALVNVLITDDGQVLAGSVSAAKLQAAASAQ